MTSRNTSTHSTGFSLIEVLIAVVVLSFGILALTALQSNLIKASTDARAQSVALALAKDQLEQMRGFQSLAQYYALTDGSDSINDTNAGTNRFSGNLGGVTGNLGGTNFTRSWMVTRYALPITGGVPSSTYAVVGTKTGALNTASYVQNSEFKTIQVTVGWTDAANQGHSVMLEDAIAALDPVDSARNQRSNGGRARGPKVVIFDPSSDAGVIPIAVGDGSETAATNPKPVVSAQSSGEDTIETRFDVLTYAGLTGGKALAQSKVETTVIGCTCTKAATTTTAYRPTYWDGFRYVPPKVSSITATARPATGVTQSRYCTECCRDHDDPATATGAKFSPRRATHTHYKPWNATDGWVVAGNGDNYIEACRLVRVDGIFDVAADLSDDYMNLLDTGTGTNDSQFGNDPAPNSSAVTAYQSFVLDYLNQRFVPGTGTTPPSGNTQQPLTHAYNDRASPAANAIAATHLVSGNGLENPRPTRNISTSGDQRWLHARGIYIDFLEPAALDAINDARSNCTDADNDGTVEPSEIQTCVLRALPFTTINLTELAVWEPLSGSSIKVSNANFDDSLTSTNPIRGLAESLGLTTPNPVSATAKAGASNSGVAISPAIMDPSVSGNEVDLSASQPFNLVGGSPSPGGTFRFGTSSGYAINNASPRILDFYYGTSTLKESCGVSGTLNPVDCTTRNGEALPAVSMRLRVGNYNKSGTIAVNNPCDNGPKVDMPYTIDYDITGFTSTNASALPTVFTLMQEFNPNKAGAPPAGEYTEVTATNVNAGDTITANMSGPAYFCPANYPNAGQSYSCVLSGNKQVPQWDTGNMVLCPSQAGVPSF